MNSTETETVADVLAEMRDAATSADAWRAGMAANVVMDFADRVETAARRERDRAVEHATRHAEAVARDNCRDCVHNPSGKNYEGGNAAAIRDIVTALAAVILPPRGKAVEDGWLAWVRAMQAKTRAVLTEKSSAVGNPVAMREALANLVDVIERYASNSPLWWHNGAKGVTPLKNAKAALADATTEKSSAVGNAAAMREALDATMRFLGNLEIEPYSPLDEDVSELRQRIMDALSAPARNCDLYASATEALKAQDVAFNEDNFKNGECKLGCPGCDDGLIDCKILWLFAPAEKRKGEGDGR